MGENKSGTIMAVCISPQKGTAKQNINQAMLIKDFGIENDAHAGNWHRQISLLSYDKVEEFKKNGANVDVGAFGENLLVKGIDFKQLPVGTFLKSGTVLLQVTQIGKECHSHCAIYQQVGDCIMPREGIFAKVLQGGKLCVGDVITVDTI